MDNNWLFKRNCGIHMTIRDIDCKDYDAEAMAEFFYNMGVTFFSFFAGGYITTYPSKLKYSRISPWLGEKDVTKDTVIAAHKYGIKAIAMADLSILPKFISDEHPEWAMVNRDGQPYEHVSNIHTACVMSGYAEEYGRSMVKEIIESYDVDAMKFGGGSYGFNKNICYCENCRKSYYDMFKEKIPIVKQWNDPHWKRYHQWRMIQTSKRVKFLHDMVTSVKKDMLVMGNGTCFGDPSWTINSALDMEDMAYYQDMIQVEAQTRYWADPDLKGHWDPLTMTAEEANYMTSVTDKPIWVVVSYFKAWPWRRAAMQYAEQKVFMAQILANGASPMINLSGGPPKVHEDIRGFKAPTELYKFMHSNEEYFNDDVSKANVALVYSQPSMVFYGGENAEEFYLDMFKGYEKSLYEAHIPFDIISNKTLDEQHLSKYKVIILPNFACMRTEEAEAISKFVNNGGSIIATYETSLYDEMGKKRDDFLLSDIINAKYIDTGNVNGVQPEGKQNYCRIHGEHDLTKGFEGTTLIPVGGNYCRVRQIQSCEKPLKLTAPFIIFPEGLSYTTDKDIGDPLALCHEKECGSRVVYLPGMFEKMHWKIGMYDTGRLLSNAVRWAVGSDLPASCNAPNTVHVTIRQNKKSTMIHMVNLTGGERMIKEIVPINNYDVYVSKKLCPDVTKAFLLSDKVNIDICEKDNMWMIKIISLKDYDVLVLE